PAVMFRVNQTGTWAYNAVTADWRHISTAKAARIAEGADGYLFGVYSSGTYRYNYWSNNWAKLATNQATQIDASNDNTLYANFISGSYDDGTWVFDRNLAGRLLVKGSTQGKLAA